MNTFSLLFFVLFITKSLTTLFDLFLHRKDISALFFLKKNIRYFLYCYQNSHHFDCLINQDYCIKVYTNNTLKTSTYVENGNTRANIFFMERDKYLTINQLKNIFLIGFFFKKRISKLEKDILEKVSFHSKYKNISGNIIDNN